MPPESLTSNINDVALVFEGGGMRAAYTSATIRVLLENELFFDWVGGISAGSSNTINYLTRDPERARKSFVDLVLDPNFGSWRTWARGKGVFNSAYIYEQTGAPGQALPFDWETFVANPASFRIGGFHCRTGHEVYWGRDDVTDLTGLVKRVRASSTMPGLMPITTIDGEDYVDGALGPTGGIAIDAAKADGYEKFFVVLTRPADYRKPEARYPAAYRRIFRKYPEVARGVLERPANYNRTLDELAELERQGSAYVFRPEHMAIGNRERRIDRLQAAHGAGLAQARREAPRWREFLGR